VQQSTSGSTELAASSEQMSKMSRGMLELMGRFSLAELTHAGMPSPERNRSSRRAAAGAQV